MNWFRVKAFFKYYFRAITKYNTHSPFLFDFVSHVLDTDKNYYIFDDIEAHRKVLLTSDNKIKVTDFGAGSQMQPSGLRSISGIAKSSISSVEKCRILFNLTQYYNCKLVLEFGTSLGISSSYLASAGTSIKVVTLEGDEKIAALANNTHQSLGLKNIDIKVGQFNLTLPQALNQLDRMDLVFLDGHHQYQPTLDYFESVITKCHENSIIVLDDIYWSEGMENAWKSIIQRPEVTLSIDLFDIGIVFLKKDLSKENITFIPYHYKPWKIGLFG